MFKREKKYIVHGSVINGTNGKLIFYVRFCCDHVINDLWIFMLCMRDENTHTLVDIRIALLLEQRISIEHTRKKWGNYNAAAAFWLLKKDHTPSGKNLLILFKTQHIFSAHSESGMNWTCLVGALSWWNDVNSFFIVFIYDRNFDYPFHLCI